jgi:hypothetical protein
MLGVITGDIVHSRKLKDPELWLKPLKEVLSTIAGCSADWEIYRGDSFQIQVHQPERLLENVMQIKAMMLQLPDIDVRMGIGIGEVRFKARRVPESNGSAFELSGLAFERLQKNRLRIETPWDDINEQWEIILPLAEWIMNRWTPPTAEVVTHFLQHPTTTQKQLAAALGIGQGRISERLSRAAWSELKRMEELFRQQITQKMVIG